MKKIKEKWLDKDFLLKMSEIIEELSQNPVDIKDKNLSGIALDKNSPVEQLRTARLAGSTLYNVNLSHSLISCYAHDANWEKVNFEKSKFDRCYMEKSQIKNCNFQEAKLIINADSTVFEDCSFIKTKFGIGTYGYEYGGRRTKFYNCDFTDAVFRNQEFRASQFFNCNFTRTRFINCDLRGIKIEGEKLKDEQFEKMEIPEIR